MQYAKTCRYYKSQDNTYVTQEAVKGIGYLIYIIMYENIRKRTTFLDAYV